MAIRVIKIEKLSHKRPRPSPRTEIVLIGLTPGKQQHLAIEKAASPRQGAFKGYMRKQMFEWFQKLRLSDYLDLEDEDTLFNDHYFSKRLFVTSLLREPVYIKQGSNFKNYSGRNPLPWHNAELLTMMQETLDLLDTLQNNCLVIPLGKVVSQAIKRFSELDEYHFILHGFPHPSGANGHRGREFTENQRRLKKIVKEYFESR